MNELSFQDPQIEVMVQAARKDEVLKRLALEGFRPIVARAPIDMRTSVPLLIDLASLGAPDELHGLGLSGLDVHRPVILLGKVPAGTRPGPNQVNIASLDHLASLPARLDLRRRSLLRESERRLRQETEREFGNPLYFEAQAEAQATPCVLYIGPMGARFIPLSKGLASRGVEVVAAMTIQTALMHLQARQFRLLIVDPAYSCEDVESLVAGRGDLPVYVTGQDTHHGFDGCVDIDEDAETAYDFLADRARSLPLCTRLEKVRLGATSHDPLTGLYSEAFLRAHLPRQMDSCAQFETPLTLLHIRSREGVFDREDMVLLADETVSNLRETDLLARLDQTSFIAVLRDTPYAGAARLAQRLLDVISANPGLGSDFVKRLSWRAVERRGSFTPERLIQVARSGPYCRPIAA